MEVCLLCREGLQDYLYILAFEEPCCEKGTPGSEQDR